MTENTASRPRKRKRSGRLGWILGSLATLAFLAVVVGLFVNQNQQMARIAAATQEANAKYAASLERNQNAHRTLESIGSDAYIEQIARDKLGMVKPGERIVDASN
jgi:cell division protein FtsB